MSFISQNKFWAVVMSHSIVGLLGITARPSDPDQAVIAVETSAEAFDQMMSVISHKRCVNCHPSGDQPHQGEDSHPHRFGVERGED